MAIACPNPRASGCLVLELATGCKTNGLALQAELPVGGNHGTDQESEDLRWKGVTSVMPCWLAAHSVPSVMLSGICAFSRRPLGAAGVPCRFRSKQAGESETRAPLPPEPEAGRDCTGLPSSGVPSRPAGSPRGSEHHELRLRDSGPEL